MKKRIVTVVLVLSMILCSTSAVPAFAAGNESAQDLNATVERHTLLHPEGETEEEGAYEEHAALVMFKTTKKVSEKKAKEALQTGDSAIQDFQIEETYSFEKKQSSGIESKKLDYSSVCLVTSETMTTEQLVKTLRKRDDVLYAEPNYRTHIYDADVNDPYFSRQWSMQDGENTSNVSAVWDEGTTGSDKIVVAVVDTGVNYNHEDLKECMWVNKNQPVLSGKYGYDFVDGDSDPMDENGHGSHCAGIIGAQGNNGIGISGVNQNIQIMALRALDENGSSCLTHEVAAYYYINEALDLGEPVRVINNSWGGGEGSKIFAELIDIVGEKGAISCFAAGNDGKDNDANPYYPSFIMSPYKLTVAATTEDGKLAGFSNYGKESVDVAAPGTNILSTVSYDCYNPSIYGSDQYDVSAKYNNYESEEEWGSAEQLKANLYLNGEPYDPESSEAQIRFSSVNGGFQDSDGKALAIEMKNLKEKDLICMTLPYELAIDAQTAPAFSLVEKSEGKNEKSAVLGAVDLPQGTPLTLKTIGGLDFGIGAYIGNNSFDRWSHSSFLTVDDQKLQELQAEARQAEASGETPESLKREVVLLVYAYEDGDILLHLDDLGFSRQDLSGTGVFGQYDYMNGTSMATPFITGAVALLTAEEEKETGTQVDPGLLVGKVASMTKEGTLPIASGGIFDFTKLPESLVPRIGNVRVDKAGGTITINGSGLNAAGLTVELGDGDEMQEAEIVTQTEKKLVVKDNKWINNVVNICVTDQAGRRSARSNHYLVDGKKKYIAAENAEDSTLDGLMATDGRYIYSAYKYNDGTILAVDTEALEEKAETLCTIDPSTLFDLEKNPDAEYAMELSDDLVYLNGKLYAVVEYGKAEEMEPEKDYTEDYWHDGEFRSKRYRIYSGDFRLISIDTETGEVENLGALPADLKKTSDYTITAYNGRLFFLGGYSYESGALTSKVKVYDPENAENSWSDGTPLPEARAHGKALQSGDCLIYTLGWSGPLAESEMEDYHCPANLILKGEEWTKSSIEPEENLEPFWLRELVVRGDDQYPLFEVSVSAVKDGLLYMGMQAADYGDTFLYNVSEDAYQDTGYQFYRNLYPDRFLKGIAVGDTEYGFDGEQIYLAKASDSALFSVEVENNEDGTVSGPAKVVPGNNAVYEIEAEEGYEIQSITVDSKPTPLDKNTEQKTITIENVVADHTVNVVFAKKVLSITVKKNTGGTVTGPTAVLWGNNAVYNIAAKTGYVIKSIKVDAKTIAVNKDAIKKTVTLEDVKENHTVNVTFAKKSLTVTVKKNKGGTVSGPKKVPRGGNAVYKVKAKKGYVIKSIKVGSKKTDLKKNQKKKTVKLKNVSKNLTIKVKFGKK